MGSIDPEFLGRLIDEHGSALEAAARREHCDWELPIRDNPNPFGIRLGEIQETRFLARIVALRTRLQILDGDYAGAVRSLQIGFSLARDVGRVPLVIPGLIAVAITHVMAERLQELSQCPDAPNLYWALAALPLPLIELGPAVETEGATAYQMFPFLRDARSASRTPREWQELLEDMTQRLGRWGADDIPFMRALEEPTASPSFEQLAHAAVVLDVLVGDLCFRTQLLFSHVEVRNLVGKVFGFDGDRGEKISKRLARRHAEPLFHLLGADAAEERLIPLAANAGEALLAPHALVDQPGQLFLRRGQLAAGAEALDLSQTFLDHLLLARLHREVGLSEGNRFFGRVAILCDEVTGVAGQRHVINLSLSA
jgi:hypothetical protein